MVLDEDMYQTVKYYNLSSGFREPEIKVCSFNICCISYSLIDLNSDQTTDAIFIITSSRGLFYK